MDCRVKPGNDDVETRREKSFSRRILRPSFAHHHDAISKKIRFRQKKGSGAPKGACQPCPRYRKQVDAVCATYLLRGCAHLAKTRARLSAPTLAALAKGFYPDGSAPEPGFPKSQARRVFCPLA
jgi:hypothetical protein